MGVVLKKQKSNYTKSPSININGFVKNSWPKIIDHLLNTSKKTIKTISIECYQGVDLTEIKTAFSAKVGILNTYDFFKSEQEVLKMTQGFITDDEVFGHIAYLQMEDFFDKEKVYKAKQIIKKSKGKLLVMGPGALLISPDSDIKIYADLARWEIQLRMRKNQINGLGVVNKDEPISYQYKRGFFVDWRVCDKHKKKWFLQCEYLLDTNKAGNPKLVEMPTIKEGLQKAANQPFSFVPYFDPGPWGGHWLEKVCDLETENVPNYAWCMNCVPEENSLLFSIDEEIIEIPGINLVFFESKNLLGNAVEARFGKEFPIRFDFLDTIDGGNLSLQVHPDTTYIQENFGMHYTQDESYYILDAKEDASVYLGIKEGADVDKMISELKDTHDNGGFFNADNYVNNFPAKKHDHFLIPAGTIHCSGKNSMVLEISSTPYIFTFKMWDWGRLGLDGKPRPINIEHAANVISRNGNTTFVKNELINVVELINATPGCIEERTGLHEREFIETRRHWFTEPVLHKCNGSVNVLMLVEGRKAIIESPDDDFEPFVIHFAEAIVIPASIKRYKVSPYGESKNKRIATIKAFVRI